MQKKQISVFSLTLVLILSINIQGSIACPFQRSIGPISESNFKRGVVVSKNKIASQVGADILNSGGNAVDAAVATGYALGVVEPNGSGIGGGGFALVYMQDSKQLLAIDFRERAPGRINETSYEFIDGPKAGGIPGTVMGLEYLRTHYGTKTRSDLIDPSIKLAGEGFLINETLHNSIKSKESKLNNFQSSKSVFLPNSIVPETGYILKQPDLAQTLKDIEKGGEEEFYHGELAKKISKNIQKAGGLISFEDLENYELKIFEPICGSYRSEFKVCSFPPPSSGGIVLIEVLNILEKFDLNKLSYKSVDRIHYLVEAMKFGFADRATELGDPEFNNLDIETLTSKQYAKKIAEQIKNSSKAIPSESIKTSFLEVNEKPETTHFTVVDKDGNIVVITSSLNGGLGSGFVIPETGIMLNNTLDDFSVSKKANQYGLLGNQLNFPEPYKTPLSSMSPTIVFDKSNVPILALGSPGGPTIITAVLNTILAYIDQNMSLKDAVAAGRVHHQWKPDHIYSEEWVIDGETKSLLKEKYNHKFPEDNESKAWKKFYWTVQAVELDWENKQLIGESDPRSEQGFAYEN